MGEDFSHSPRGGKQDDHSEMLETIVNALDGSKLNESLSQEDQGKFNGANETNYTQAGKEKEGRIENGSGNEMDSEDDLEANGEGEGGEDGVKKKKKKKKKSKTKSKSKSEKAAEIRPNQGRIPDEEPTPAAETPEETKRWEKDLRIGTPMLNLPAWGLLHDRSRHILSTFLTPSCKRLELKTPRLKLRQVEIGDLTAIRRIKMEPVVQKTQLYGSPSMTDIKESFQNRYVRSSMPRASMMQAGKGRDEFVFAITAINPSEFEVKPPGDIRIANRISSTEGYMGNIALSFTYSNSNNGTNFLPKKGEVYTQPTFGDMDKSGVEGKMFYEIHPQLWGQGIMSEAFDEVLRFGMEEVGCTSIACDPTTKNEASIKLCTKNGLKYVKEVNNQFNRPQLFHAISREEWWARNRPEKEVNDRWGGKEVCRWCMNFRLAPPTIQCSHCDWAKYCSRECQRADWVRAGAGGHQAECDQRKR